MFALKKKAKIFVISHASILGFYDLFVKFITHIKRPLKGQHSKTLKNKFSLLKLR